MKTIFSLSLVSAIGLFTVGGAQAGKGKFSDGLSSAEVAQLTKSMATIESDFNKAKPTIKALKGNHDIVSNPKLSTLAGDVIKSHTEIGLFLVKMKELLKAKDAKLNSYEVKLQGEVANFELKLKALQKQAKAAHVESVATMVASVILLADALTADYLAFDHVYDLALADVDLTLYPVYDVYTEIVVPADVYVVHEVHDDDHVVEHAVEHEEHEEHHDEPAHEAE